MRLFVVFAVIVLQLHSASSLHAQTSTPRFSSPTQSSRIWNQAFRGTGSQYLRAGAPTAAAPVSSVVPVPHQHSHTHWGQDYSWNMNPFGRFTSWQAYSSQVGFVSGHRRSRYYTSSHWSPYGWGTGLPACPSGSGLYTTWPGTTQLIPLEWWWNGVPWYSTWNVPPAIVQPQISIQISGTADQQGIPVHDAVHGALPAPPASPLLQDEFEPPPAGRDVPPAPLPLQALRSQSAGDAAFRAGDYALADQHYAEAAEDDRTAGGLLIRRMLARIMLQDFGQASVHLRQLLQLDDPQHVPLNLQELYGLDPIQRESHSATALWDWLEERPESADRLLLMAAFQGLHGRSSLSLQLLQQLGGIPENAEQTKRLARIIARSTGSAENNTAAPQKAASLVPTAVAAETGIVIRGEHRILAADRQHQTD